MNWRWTVTWLVLAIGVIGIVGTPLTALAVPETLILGGTIDSSTVGTIPIGTPWSASVMYDTTVAPTGTVGFPGDSAFWNNISTFVYSFTVGAETVSPMVSAKQLFLL